MLDFFDAGFSNKLFIARITVFFYFLIFRLQKCLAEPTKFKGSDDILVGNGIKLDLCKNKQG
jgi:hypothetical protein